MVNSKHLKCAPPGGRGPWTINHDKPKRKDDFLRTGFPLKNQPGLICRLAKCVFAHTRGKGGPMMNTPATLSRNVS